MVGNRVTAASHGGRDGGGAWRAVCASSRAPCGRTAAWSSSAWAAAVARLARRRPVGAASAAWRRLSTARPRPRRRAGTAPPSTRRGRRASPSRSRRGGERRRGCPVQPSAANASASAAVSMFARGRAMDQCVLEPPSSVSTGRRQLAGKSSTGCRRAARHAVLAWPHEHDHRHRHGPARPQLEHPGRPAAAGAGSTTGTPRTNASGRRKGATDRPQEPDLLDLRRAPRLQRLGAVDDRRDQPRQRRHRRSSLSEQFWLTAVPNLVGVDAADPVHVRGAAVRRAAVDRRSAPRCCCIPRCCWRSSCRAAGWRDQTPRHAVLGAARLRGDRRRRRRQLLVVDGEHLVLLSRAAARASRSASTPPAATSASPSRSCSCRW